MFTNIKKYILGKLNVVIANKPKCLRKLKPHYPNTGHILSLLSDVLSRVVSSAPKKLNQLLRENFPLRNPNVTMI